MLETGWRSYFPPPVEHLIIGRKWLESSSADVILESNRIKPSELKTGESAAILLFLATGCDDCSNFISSGKLSTWARWNRRVSASSMSDADISEGDVVLSVYKNEFCAIGLDKNERKHRTARRKQVVALTKRNHLLNREESGT
ncbi:hypothetical protein ACJJTC_001077, partial [Scirpophaga incertulas]